MPFVNNFRVLYKAGQLWVANQDSRWGAALAYYTLFSIAPLLIIAIRIAGIFFGEQAAHQNVFDLLVSTMGQESAEAISKLVENAARPTSGMWATAVSIGVLMIGALSVFLHVRSALSIIWKLQPPSSNTFVSMFLNYLLALIMVLFTGAILLLSLAASMVVPILRETLNKQFPEIRPEWQYLEFGISVILLTLLFTAVFRILSGQIIPWGYVLYGAIFTALLFCVGKIALGMYLVYTGTASMYGAAGSLVVFLIWVYYSSQILFFGAELIQARRTRHEWMGKKT